MPSRLPSTSNPLHHIAQLYKRVCGPELLARHPMSYYEAEEDDLLFAINYGCVVRLSLMLACLPYPPALHTHLIILDLTPFLVLSLPQNNSVGWYSAIQFPSSAVWMKVGQISKFSPRDKRHLFCYYQRGTQELDCRLVLCGGRRWTGRFNRLTDWLTD